MKQYRILVQKHQLKNNKLANFNDLVDETQLNGNAKELVEAGFVELVDSKENLKNIEVKEPKEVKPKK